MPSSTPTTPTTPRLLWQHPSPESTAMAQFLQLANRTHNLRLATYHDLHAWSTGPHRTAFWSLLWQHLPIIHAGHAARPVDDAARIDALPRWFEGVTLNWAENMLLARASTGAAGVVGKEDAKVAVTEVREGAAAVRNVSYGELRRRVGLLVHALRARGVAVGDRVAVVASNSVDTLVVLLAVVAVGGVFSSSATDMGTKGVLDRLVQIEPRWVFVDDAAVYNGRTIDLRHKITEIIAGMKSVQGFQGVVAIPRFERAADLAWVPRTMSLSQFLEAGNGNDRLVFERVGFNDPFLIVYSSGTTGMPKCIVHSHGGILINTFKEGKIHRGLGPGIVSLQYTTTGWIMYLTAVSSLLFGGRSVLYDGSPFLPDPTILLKLVESQKVTHLGVSPRYFQELQKHNITPKKAANLNSLISVSSTGMVLKESLFEWFYDVAFPKTVHLCNISGGTDIAGCFVLENQMLPLYVGGCQSLGLGIAVAVYDQLVEGGVGVQGTEVKNGVPGELVATKSFPNMPIYFWGADSSKKYFNSYFARFDNVWTHGDFIAKHPTTQQILLLGRADGVLNPSGIRFGSAEIYGVVETHFAGEIADSICVGQRRAGDDDETVLLFVLMARGHAFSPQLAERVRGAIARALSKRHVPARVFETPAIPVTINGKKVELPVKQIVSGYKVKPSSTLANPESLEYYYQFADLQKSERAKL